MAKHGGAPSEKKPDDLLTVTFIMLGCLAAIMIMIWVRKDVAIIRFWTPKLILMAKTWLWLPDSIGIKEYATIIQTANKFLHAPKAVSLIDWIGFINKASLVPVAALTTLQGLYLIRLLFKDPDDVKRRLKPNQLARRLSYVFTGSAPILHLRKALANDTDPYWRRQVFPHEVLLNERVRGRPLIVDDEVDEERATAYFMGIVEKRCTRSELYPDGWMPDTTGNGTRLVSRMLGRQVVDLIQDSGRKTIYPDRFSNTGKVIYALLCAHAFGGHEGKDDYRKASDALNNSARNAPHGFANLTVAQWLYDKYRTNPEAMKLFAIHHWEYTYLFELLIQAKRQGKCGHWEFLWLKPMNRILFYVMNTVGSHTPHTESASAFAQYAYERRVARSGRLPLTKLDNGQHVHVIYVAKAVKGLKLEWARWKEGADDDQQWWKDKDVWTATNTALAGLVAVTPPPPELVADTAFDILMREAQQRASAKEDQSMDMWTTA